MSDGTEEAKLLVRNGTLTSYVRFCASSNGVQAKLGSLISDKGTVGKVHAALLATSWTSLSMFRTENDLVTAMGEVQRELEESGQVLTLSIGAHLPTRRTFHPEPQQSLLSPTALLWQRWAFAF